MKSALQEDIRKMRIQKKQSLARLHSLNLEADKLNSDESRNKEMTSEEDSNKAELAALLAEVEAAKEKEAFLRKSIEETATVLSRDQNDIKHILDDLKNWRKKGESLRRTSELADLILSEDDIKPEIVKNATKEPSTAAYIIKVHDLEEKCLDCDHAVCWNLPQAQAVLKVNDELLVFDAMNSAEIQLKCFVFIISLDIVE